MTSRIWKSGFTWLAAGVLGLLGGHEQAGEDSPKPPLRGVVVEEVAEGSALARAGLQAGDVMLGWERLPAPPANPGGEQGEIASPFDWLWVEIEQAPRGTVKLSGERDGEAMAFVVEPGLWEAKVRPQMSGAVLDAYLKGRERIDGQQLEQGTSLWRQAAETARHDEDWPLRCWLLLRVGQVWAEARVWEKAEEAYERAWGEAREPKAQVVVREASGGAFWEQSEWERAEEAYRSAWEIRQASWGESLGATASNHYLGMVAASRGDVNTAKTCFRRTLNISRKLAPDSLMVAGSLNDLAGVAWQRGDIEVAEEYFLRALDITHRLAPNSVYLAKYLNNLSNVVADRGDLETAEALVRRALAIKEKLMPNSLTLARTIGNLGAIVYERGDLATAQDYYLSALAIREKLAPGSLEVASACNNLGNVAWERGDLALAEEYHRRALAIKEKLAPNSLRLAMSFDNLGNVTASRGDFALAEEYHRRALAIREELAPDSPQMATTLNNLGTAVEDQGDLDLAEHYYQRALDIREKVTPNSLKHAYTLSCFAGLALVQGDLTLAHAYNRQALDIRMKLAPNSVAVSGSLHGIGKVADIGGDLALAEAYYQRSLAIQKKLIPNSIKHAGNLHALGLILRKTDRLHQAADHLRQAIIALEGQISRLGVSHEREGDYRAESSQIYRDTIEVLIALSRPYEAFHTLERFRAGSLLAMLAERDLIFSTDVPEDLEKARKALAWHYDRILEQMQPLDSEKDEQKIEELWKQLRSLQRERDDVAARIRKVSQRLADLHYPKPLTLTQARNALDPGTVMLSYTVGEDATHVFVVASDKGLVGVKSLAIGEEKLRQKVDGFRHGIVHGTDPRSQFFQPVKDSGRELYQVLIRPVASVIEQSERVLIIPDGPLHLLPFSALIRESGEYLAEWKPVHCVLSATLYGELKRARPQVGDSPTMIATFGDPVYPEIVRRENPDQTADVRVRAAVKRGLFDWEPLPHTRREVEGIAALYPAKSVRSYLGEEATEERAKGLPKTTDIVHFAAHGHLDDRFPLNSAVVITIPEGFPDDRENGLLQAWEIFERVRIDADLVVLSACESALGEERGGEGLIGLTRAFQYAGARTVVASLWNVADEVTAELMVRFYSHLRAGKSKDAALQAARIELIRDPIKVRKASGKLVQRNASAPYYWAAFQVIGDWR